MTSERFKALLNELDGNSLKTLTEKNARYSSTDDSLHNFNSGGEIFGGTAAQACWGYLTKHLVALRDMVQRNDFHNRADLLEKCQDSINYIRFLWCIANEEMEKYTVDRNDLNRDFTLYCKLCDEHFSSNDTMDLPINHLIIKHGIEPSIALTEKEFVKEYFDKVEGVC